jgi:hypothetical protein
MSRSRSTIRSRPERKVSSSRRARHVSLPSSCTRPIPLSLPETTSPASPLPAAIPSSSPPRRTREAFPRSCPSLCFSGFEEGSGLRADLAGGESASLLALEAQGLVFRSGEADAFFGVEGSLLRALLPGNESSLLAGGEAWDLSTSRTVSDPSPLSSLDLADLEALFSSLETGLVLGEGEAAEVLLPVSELFPVLGDEGSWIQLLLADLLSIPATDLLPRLIRILDPRASISIEGPRATIMILEEGRRLVERIYRGTEVAVVLRFSSSIGRYYDPLSVQFLVRRPSGAVSSLSVQRIGPGTYRAELLFDEPGIWVLRAEGTDPLRAVTEKRIEVIGDL